MTRINAAIQPEELPTKLLLAEHRELKRIPNCIKKGRYSLQGIPEQFKLGSGHVKFFYSRLKYLQKRYEALYGECVKRNLNVTYFGDAFSDLPVDLFNDWHPNGCVRLLLIDRIHERGFELKKSNGFTI
jgi:deoxyribonuclease (pyrimidine dimer)